METIFKCKWSLGQEVYYIQFQKVSRGKISKIGFTKRGVRIKLSNYSPDNRDFSEEYIYETKAEAEESLNN